MRTQCNPRSVVYPYSADRVYAEDRSGHSLRSHISVPIIVVIRISMVYVARGLLAVTLLSMEHTMIVRLDSTDVDEQLFESCVEKSLNQHIRM